MWRLRLELILRAFGDLRYIEQHSRTNPPDDILPEAHRDILRPYVKSALKVCVVAGLDASEKQAERILDALSEREITTGQFTAMVADLRSRIEDQISMQVYLQVERLDLYEKPELFGAKVASKFPSTNFDVEEAGKCYALGRNTACVMHLMRVIEVGVKSAGHSLGIMAQIKGAQPNWGQVLTAIANEIKNRGKLNDPAWAAIEPFYENLYTDLTGVRRAWRNPSMHADQKYDAERAEDIFNAVKGWMRHMAEHLDEAGTFTP